MQITNAGDLSNRLSIIWIGVLILTVAGTFVLVSPSSIKASELTYYFPPPGQSLSNQSQHQPSEVGLSDSIVTNLTGKASRWALWRHGYLVHVEGNFNQNAEVKSLRKTLHALTVGAAVKQGKIPGIDQPVSVYQTELAGKDAQATWKHVMTQSASFDYPGCGDSTDYNPGEMWTYSDLNPYHLNHALAKAYGRVDYYDNYNLVLTEAYFNAIGMQGWSSQTNTDGIRLVLDLEDMGRVGLLVVAGGVWNNVEVIPQGFIEELEVKQTQGMQVNYQGCNDGTLGFLNPSQYPESPYGYFTWVNTDQDYYPGASAAWAWGAGDGGYYILWNRNNGIVFTGVGVNFAPTSNGIPQIIEAGIIGPNPLAEGGSSSTPSPSPVFSTTPTLTPNDPSTPTPTSTRPPKSTKTPLPTPSSPTATKTPRSK